MILQDGSGKRIKFIGSVGSDRFFQPMTQPAGKSKESIIAGGFDFMAKLIDRVQRA
jgi:hypothetical protein